MPKAAPRACTHPGCPALVTGKGSQCPAHAKKRQRVSDARRRTNQTGPRLYDSQRWKRLRKLVLTRDPLCVECRKKNRVTAACHVDHIVSISDGGNPFDLANLQALCASCHSRKTARQDGGYGNPKG